MRFSTDLASQVAADMSFGDVQEQQLLKSDPGHVNHDIPLPYNLLKANEVFTPDQLLSLIEIQMVGLVQRGEELLSTNQAWLKGHQMTPQNGPVKVEGLDFSTRSSHLSESNRLDKRTQKIEAIEHRDEDCKKQLGMLLCMPIALSEPKSPTTWTERRKRSHSRKLELEGSEPKVRLPRSHTSSESGECPPSCVTGSHRSGSRRSLSKSTKMESLSGDRMDKDLLSLSLPGSNSSMNSESSCSSHERDAPLSKKRRVLARSRSSKVHASLGNDGAQSNRRTAATNSSAPCHVEDNITNHRADSADDAAADRVTHLSSEPVRPDTPEADEPEYKLTLAWDSLKARAQTVDVQRAQFEPLTCAGLDAQALNQQSLLLRDLDTGLEAHGLQLVHLLLKCADATVRRNVKLAESILGELYQAASVYGDSMQRMAAYFAEGLAARFISNDTPTYAKLMAQPSTDQYCSAFHTLYKVAPYFQFAHFTANQAILEAVEGQQFVHVIDLDIMQGFQWPSLIQALATRPGGPPELRITGVGKHVTIIAETGKRLAGFAASFGVPFEFHSVVEEKIENLTPEVFAPRLGEAIAVNAVMQLHRLLANPVSGDSFHKFMHSVCERLNPRVVTMVEQEANHNAPSFLGRFMEALHYYAAVFDSLDASLPQQSEERVKVEQHFFAQQIKNIVVNDGDERMERHETFDLWKQRMETAGFVQVPLSGYAVSQAKLLLQFSPCEGYRLHERDGSICLGWQERQLITASAWSCES